MNHYPVDSRQGRRRFIRQGALAAAGAMFAPVIGRAAPRPLFTAIGVTAALERAAELKAAGADFIVETTARLLMPERPDAEFAAQRAAVAASPLPVRAANVFLRDTKLRCTGPDADHPRVLAFAEVAFRRLAEVGGEYIVFGSGPARQLPPGWTKAQADVQFVALLRAMGPLAAKHGVMVAVEAQRASECNYLNHIGEAAEVVAAASHPSIRLLGDIFHMMWMDDAPEELTRLAPLIGVVELAEKANRTPPGVAGDDFLPYFAALARGGFSGRMDIEAQGTTEQLREAFKVVRRQVTEATDGG